MYARVNDNKPPRWNRDRAAPAARPADLGVVRAAARDHANVVRTGATAKLKLKAACHTTRKGSKKYTPTLLKNQDPGAG